MENKPIDRWLTLGAAAVGVALYLLPKSPVVVIFCVLLIFGLLFHPAWNLSWIEDALWRRLLALVVLGACLAIIAVASWPARPTLMYFTPGLILNDNATRTYGLQFHGDQPLINVSVSITDDDALEFAKKNPNTAAYYFEHYSEVPLFHMEEIDPRHAGLVQWYVYKPFNLDRGTLDFDILTRDIDISERMQVHQDIPHTFPAYYLKISNSRSRKLLKECVSDSRYYKDDPTKSSLPLCCGDLYPPIGIYASCAPWYMRTLRLTEKAESFLLALFGRK